MLLISTRDKQFRIGNHQGFTLVEVLVALIILAIGLLALAGLQSSGLRNNNSAYYSSQATIHAYDILDRMRANREYARSGQYQIDIDEDPGSDLPEVVKDDLEVWKASLADALPGPGDGSISVQDSQATIVIQWYESDKDADNGSTPEEFQTVSRL